MPRYIIGESYLTEKEEARLNEIKDWQRLHGNAYNELAKKVMHDHQITKESDEKWLQIGAALPALISKVSGDLLFGEAPIIEGEDEQNQAFLDEYYDLQLKELLYQSAITQSADGGVVLKVFAEPDDESENVVHPKFQFFSQASYFPSFELFTGRRIADDILTIEKTGDDRAVIQVEHHEPGYIEYKYFEIKVSDKKITKVAPFPMRWERTGLDITPIIYFPNSKNLNNFWGKSDYDGLESLFVAINRRLTQNEHNLQMHGGGKMQGPGESKGLLNEHGKPFKHSTIDYLALTSSQIGGQYPEYKYLQPQLSVTEDLDTIKEYLKFVFLCADISPDVFGLSDGAVESGKALRLRLLRTLTMVRRKAQLWEIGLRKAINLAMEIKGIVPNYTITFQDGLPTEIDELIDQEIAKVNAGLQSQKDAIKVIDGLDDEAAEAKKAEIQKESVNRNMAFNAGLSV